MDPYPAAYDRIRLFISDLNLVLGSLSSQAPSGPLGGRPPRFDQVRPGAFSSDPAWGRPTARSRAWRRSHPKIFGQRYSKLYRPPPPVPVDNRVCRSTGTWRIPMRRDHGVRSGRKDRDLHLSSEPNPASTTTPDQEAQSHLQPICKIINESNIDSVSGLELNENQPTDEYGEGIVIPEESADQFDSGMESAVDQPGDNTSDGIEHHAHRSDTDSSDGHPGTTSGDHSDGAVCETYSDHPGSHLDDYNPVEDINSAGEETDHPADRSDADSSDEPRRTTSGDHHDITDCDIHSNGSDSQLDDSDSVVEPDPANEQECALNDDVLSNPEPGDDYQSDQDNGGYDNHADNDVYGNDDTYQEVDYGADGGYDDGGGYDYGDDGGGYEDDGGGCDYYQDDYY